MTTLPTRLGAYTIDRELGRGGMGVVYLGHDTALDRAVAIKALPEHLAGDLERLARFQREAKLLASLTHPNIAGVYGLEDHDGAHYLVMEFVEGETLADRLRSGPLPVDEALAIGAQIAAGIEAAHEAGVIHRDLKPANIIVTPEGHAKVLDFGLAKETERSSSSLDLSASPTASLVAPVTEAGRVMGTAGYLSPEQSRGKRLDKRTDIWSFACILYECLTGEILFGGETASDSIAAILEREPDFSQLPARTPPRVRELLTRCLEKDPHKRLRDIGDARLELENAIALREWTTGSFQAVSGGAKRRPWRGTGLTTLGVLIGAVVVWTVGSRFITPAADGTVATFRFDLPLIIDGEPMAIDDLAIAPDGSAIAAAPIGDGPIVVRELGSFDLRVLQGTERANWPMFSPDGQWIAFYQNNRLYRIARDGGLPLDIADARGLEGNGIWTTEGSIIDTSDDTGRTLRQVRVEDGTVEMLATLPTSGGYLGFESVCSIPGRDYVLASVYTGNSIDAYSVIKVMLADGATEEVLTNATSPMVAENGTLVFLRDSSLFAVPFDFDQSRVTGAERRVLEGVTASQWGGAANAALSWSGALVYLPGQRLSNGRRVVYVSESGEVEPITEPDALGADLSVSPDGSLIAVNTLRRAIESWIYDVARGNMRRIVSAGEAYNFRWDPDGARLAYYQLLPERSYRLSDIVIREIGSGVSPHLVATLPDMELHDWLPDGSGLLIGHTTQPDAGSAQREQLQVLRLDDPESLAPLFEHDGNSIAEPRFSPNGKWIAYISDESGQNEIYLRRYPELDRAWQVSFGDSFGMIWAPDSTALYFSQRNHMMKTTFEVVEGRVSIGAPTELFASPWPRAWSRWNAWTMGPDGRFVAIEPAKWEQDPSSPRVILNWDREISQTR